MRYRDFIQNINIAFLALLSLFLFSRTQFFQLGAAAGSGTWQRLTAPVSDQISDAPSSDTHHGQRELHPHQNTAAGGSWGCPKPNGFQCCRLPVGFGKTVSLL